MKIQTKQNTEEARRGEARLGLNCRRRGQYKCKDPHHPVGGGLANAGCGQIQGKKKKQQRNEQKGKMNNERAQKEERKHAAQETDQNRHVVSTEGEGEKAIRSVRCWDLRRDDFNYSKVKAFHILCRFYLGSTEDRAECCQGNDWCPGFSIPKPVGRILVATFYLIFY